MAYNLLVHSFVGMNPLKYLAFLVLFPLFTLIGLACAESGKVNLPEDKVPASLSTCQSNNDCNENQECISGKCAVIVKDACKDVQCNDGEICVDGACVPDDISNRGCPEIPCNLDEICENGRCLVKDDSFFPMGVTWPWETVKTQFPDKMENREKNLKQFLIKRLDDLENHNVNFIMTGNGPCDMDELGLLVELASQRKIKIIPSCGDWMIHSDNAMNEEWLQTQIKNLKNWVYKLGEKLSPFAFFIADELHPDYASQLDTFVGSIFKTSIPITMTTMHWQKDILDYPNTSQIPFVILDNYCFFRSPGNASGNYSYTWFKKYVKEYIEKTTPLLTKPWIFLQAFQKVWGPSRQEKNGNITILPGGGNHFRMPTPTDIHWQTWAAVALGAKGLGFFTYIVNGPTYEAHEDWVRGEIGPLTDTEYKYYQAALATKEWETPVGETRPTNAPMALVSWPNYQPGPQYEAMKQTYADLKPLAGFLLGLKNVSDENSEDILPTIVGPMKGDIVNVLKDSEGTLFLAIVADPTGNGEIYLELLPNVKALIPLFNAPASSTNTTDTSKNALVKLTPGKGAFYKIVLH